MLAFVSARCASYFHCSFCVLAALFFLAFGSRAAIPTPEQLLPEDTLVLLTTPNYAKLSQICQESPKSRLWNDPVMKPLKDKFLSRWQEEVVKPLERDLNLSLENYGGLPQGQVTFAVIRNAWQGSDEQPLGFLFLLDAQGKTDLLKTNLADLRKKWVAAGKTLRTEKIRSVEFSIFPVTTNDVPKTLSKFLWRPPVFAPVSSGPDVKQGPVSPSGQGDMLLDMLTVLLTASKELVIGQVESLLIVGNSTRDVEKVVIRLTGGAVPTLGELPAYQASHQALFREEKLRRPKTLMLLSRLNRKSLSARPVWRVAKRSRLSSRIQAKALSSSSASTCRIPLAKGSFGFWPAQPARHVPRLLSWRMPWISSAGD
ncbi:MAG: hypothetical protein NT154_33235 [Verrucomicrobia bacterium]|nr:hypothetical protein [Verrucomicrobiota bacterium]